MYEDSPPPYSEASPVFTQGLIKPVLASCIGDINFTTDTLFKREIWQEEQRLCDSGHSRDARITAEHTVTKRWERLGYKHISSAKQLKHLIETDLQWRVGQPVTAKFPTTGDDPDDCMLSRPIVQQKIVYWVLLHFTQSEDCPEIYQAQSPHDVIKQAWGLNSKTAEWLWPGEDSAEVARKLNRFEFRVESKELQRQLRRSKRLEARLKREAVQQSHGNSLRAAKTSTEIGSPTGNNKQTRRHRRKGGRQLQRPRQNRQAQKEADY